ncbi:Nucleotidyltransferase [Rozella allomycis CSF55]|uniref:polynucleotide adenylyltransferase n=1 Tax=Rozella allomycis (strain CSF55) TaxID=988480 RepID=A0A075AUN2_ROZAC|nr:hypothetical protein O9G_002581 [Rozella allomycis CSF55]RKP21176.1 Nucleotidyltransferase [Rozella allomycis CSF55]|eukprot:EPZ32229.1 hypothetical protein O9G_002581 [Rozella allomycis CSF55]
MNRMTTSRTTEQKTSISSNTAKKIVHTLEDVERDLQNMALKKQNETCLPLTADSKTIKKPDDGYLKTISAKIDELVMELSPTENEIQEKEDLFKKLEKICHELFPGSTLYKFGSMSNGFSLKNADMDLCLVMDDASVLTAVQIVETLGEKLRMENDFKDILMLPRARIPIVKLKSARSNISCDIGYNNVLAVHNTLMLRAYSDIDERLKKVAFLIKYWAKRRKINEPYFGSLSRKVPILPVLQRLPHDFNGENNVQGYNAYFFKDISKLKSVWKGVGRNKQSTGELLFEIFHYFAYDFPVKEGVVSIREGSVLSKEDKNWTVTNNTKTDKYWFCVEDPFEITHNLGRLVDRDTLYDIRGEFMRACKLMNQNASLEDICKEYME